MCGNAGWLQRAFFKRQNAVFKYLQGTVHMDQTLAALEFPVPVLRRSTFKGNLEQGLEVS